MDWKIFFMTFGAVFIAELADKTQLVGIGMASKSGRPLSVWFGSVVAYMIVTVISVSIGALLGKYLNQDLIRYAGGAIFVLLGVLMLFRMV